MTKTIIRFSLFFRRKMCIFAEKQRMTASL